MKWVQAAIGLGMVASAAAFTTSPSSSRWVNSRGAATAERRSTRTQRRSTITAMGRKFENNKMKMAKTAAAYNKKASYIGKKILQCVKEKGPDADSNRQLGLLMKEASKLGVTKDVVNRNIKAGSDPNTADFKELTYEAYGVGGVGFIINCLSDNVNRAAADVNAAINKVGFSTAASGSVLFNFEKKARLCLTSEIDEDSMIEVAMEADVDDCELEAPNEDKGDDLEKVKNVVYVGATELGAMVAALDEAGYECTSSLVYVPMATVECSEEDLEINLAGLDKLEEIGDCDTVDHNMLIV